MLNLHNSSWSGEFSKFMAICNLCFDKRIKISWSVSQDINRDPRQTLEKLTWSEQNLAAAAIEQARVPFAEDYLPMVGLEASAEGNMEKRPYCGSCALPGEQMATDRTFLQNILFHCSSIKSRWFFIQEDWSYFKNLSWEPEFSCEKVSVVMV